MPISTRWDIVHYKRLGYSGSEVSQIVSVPTTTCNYIYRKWKDTGNVEDLSKSGRPLKTSMEEEEMLIETCLEHPDMTVNDLLEETKIDVSKTTGWRVLRSNGFKCKTSRTKWSISPEHQKERLKWAKEYIKKPDNFWEKVIFTDECKIQYNTKRQKLWLPEETMSEPIEQDRYQFSILVWGAISYDGTSILEIVNQTMNSDFYLKILNEGFLRTCPVSVHIAKKEIKQNIWCSNRITPVYILLRR